MHSKNFRPWGLIDWVVNRISVSTWHVLGCIATEERSLAAWRALNRHGKPRGLFLNIDDSASLYRTEAKEITAKRQKQLMRIAPPSNGVLEYDLFATDGEIKDCLDKFVETTNGNIILDITTFPKRFFFPFVMLLLKNINVTNLIITYSVPKFYRKEALAEEHSEFQHLPLFGQSQFPEPPVETVMVGVGFMPFGLAEFLEPYKHKADVKLILPFPPGPPSYQRNWEFVAGLREYAAPAARDPIRVSAYDVSDIFDHISEEANNKVTIFAPYGPKPMSLAMCIYASLTQSQVYYTQPKTYHVDYSSGLSSTGANEEIYAYPLRLASRNFYKSN